MRKPKEVRQFVHLGDNPPEEIVYEVHIDPPVEHAGHYIGKSPKGGLGGLLERLAKHGGPEGARLLQVARERGSTWELVRTWEGGERKERQLKTRSGALYCPRCAEHPQPGDTPPRQDARYLTRKQRAERQAIREARAKDDPWADLEMRETTYDGLQEQLRGGRQPAKEPTPEEDAEQLAHLNGLEAQWRVAREATPKVRELELEAG